MAEKRASAQRKKAQPRLSFPEPSPTLSGDTRHLPPLNAVRAFEAAARHRGFARAAAELNVSPGAVSRQVKLLEQALETALFRRDAQAVQLTDHGRRLLPLAQQAFDLLQQMQPRRGRDDSLRLQVSASFYLRWLMPRLAGLKRAFPKLKLDLAITSALAGAMAGGRDGADATIFYRRLTTGVTALPDAEGDLLFADGSVLVCAPGLLARRRLPLPVSMLCRLPLLLNTQDGWDWRALADHIGLPDLALNGADRFDIDDNAIQAALAGQGIGLVEQRFIGEQLATGQLVRPFDVAPLSLGEYRVRWAPGLLRRQATRQLRDWLLAEASMPPAASRPARR